jgi:UDP-3-O-[3-hydroxymyristoyl] N-acetylglucosamine deacetylase
MSAAAVAGVGLHSGRPSRVRLHREPGPLRFRIGRREVPADAAAVIATRRCTVLGAHGVRVSTVEHLLAALRVAGFWSDVVVEVHGPELPILDGSAGPWREPIAALGAPPSAPPAWRPAAPVRFEHAATRIRLDPGPERLTAIIEYREPAIGRQRWSGGPPAFASLLEARTFATRAEVTALLATGGLLGAAEDRGIVFDDDGPAVPLRWPDEPVRHKALDAVGDLSLFGRPLAGHLTIERGSHAAHLAFMLQLRSLPATSRSEAPS